MQFINESDENEIKINFFFKKKEKSKKKRRKICQNCKVWLSGKMGNPAWQKIRRCYSTTGNKGLAIELLNGKNFRSGPKKKFN